jgi:metal-sulfur cluster biosynthetic enzyme
MAENETLRQAILDKLSSVIDPETGVDVVRMRLIEDLHVDDKGHAAYTFRPSSVFCPIAVPLSNSIQLAVAEVPGVSSQDVNVVGFALSKELAALLKQMLDDWQREHRPA